MTKIIKKLYILLHPLILFERIRWILFKHKFKKCGKKSLMGYKFSVIEPFNICIGDYVYFGQNCKIACYEKHFDKFTGYKPKLVFDNYINFGNNCYISCLNKIEIESGVLTGDNVSIIDNYHGRLSKDEIEIRPIDRELYSKGSIHIGKNVWVGKNVCIMPNVTIGDYAVIGANAVVTHDIPAYAIAAGVPARVIKMMRDV